MVARARIGRLDDSGTPIEEETPVEPGSPEVLTAADVAGADPCSRSRSLSSAERAMN